MITQRKEKAMKKSKYFCIILLLLNCLVLFGCGNSTAKSDTDSDGFLLVQVPENSTIQDLFTFKSTKQLYLTGGTSFGVADGSIYIGILEDGNSVVWRTDSTFLYVPGEASDTSIIYYGKQFAKDPISYQEFQSQIENK